MYYFCRHLCCTNMDHEEERGKENMKNKNYNIQVHPKLEKKRQSWKFNDP